MQEVKNKAREVLGTYVSVKALKVGLVDVDCTDKTGNSITVTKEITKEDISKLATQQFNTNIRNYIAGLAREKKDSKLALMKEFIRSQGYNVDLSTEELKKQFAKK